MPCCLRLVNRTFPWLSASTSKASTTSLSSANNVSLGNIQLFVDIYTTICRQVEALRSKHNWSVWPRVSSEPDPKSVHSEAKDNLWSFQGEESSSDDRVFWYPVKLRVSGACRVNGRVLPQKIQLGLPITEVITFTFTWKFISSSGSLEWSPTTHIQEEAPPIMQVGFSLKTVNRLCRLGFR